MAMRPTRERPLTGAERLTFHPQHRAPLLEEWPRWLDAQLVQKKTEPNSSFGPAITYLLRHGRGLTAFLREKPAPLENNLCERALKRAVRQRKKAWFYRPRHGAQGGDLFMSLLHTCERCGVNSFEYLTELPRHPRELTTEPERGRPWNYRHTLAQNA
jgi:transposase